MINLFRGERGRRVNPFMVETYDIMNKLSVFDGDHALLNDFAVRSNTTIQEVIDATERKESVNEDYENWQTKDDLRELLKSHTKGELGQMLDEICAESGWD